MASLKQKIPKHYPDEYFRDKVQMKLIGFEIKIFLHITGFHIVSTNNFFIILKSINGLRSIPLIPKMSVSMCHPKNAVGPHAIPYSF